MFNIKSIYQFTVAATPSRYNLNQPILIIFTVKTIVNSIGEFGSFLTNLSSKTSTNQCKLQNWKGHRCISLNSNVSHQAADTCLVQRGKKVYCEPYKDEKARNPSSR